MSTLAVARKEFGDTRRSRTLLAVVGLFVIATGGVTYIYVEFFTSASPNQQPDSALELTTTAVTILGGLIPGGFGPVDLLVPVIGLLLGYKAIVGERESGRIKLLLGLPHSRRDVVFGKLLGRAAVAALAVVAGFVAVALVLALLGSGLSLAPLVILLVLTLLLAVVYVSLGISISAVSPTTGWATALVVTVVALFQALWGVIFFAIRFVVLESPQDPPTWFRTLQRVAPPNAYKRALIATLDGLTGAPIGNLTTPPDAPVLLQDWFGFVWLAVWAAVPIALGYVQFDGSDLT